MADTLTVTLPDPLAEEVRVAAAAQGMSPEEFVRQQVVDGLAASELDWDEDLRRLHEPGDHIALDGAFGRLSAMVAEARARRQSDPARGAAPSGGA